MKKLVFILFVIPFLTIAQEKGIAFEHNSTWDKVKAKAKAENKHIFVDCFTTWCGPCKYMASTIFPQEKVGDFFNANFVNLKLQMDETKEDSEEVKSWYTEAKRFSEDYKIVAYPTFLIFNPEGELVHRIVGGGEADKFIELANAGLNPETQYMTVVKKFEQNPNDPEIAKKTAAVAAAAYDNELNQKATARYIDLVGSENLLNADGIDMLIKGVTTSSSPAFKIIKDNSEKVNELLGSRKINANDILVSALSREYITPATRNKEKPVDFAALKAQLEKEHPYVDMTTAILRTKTQYYLAENNWPAFRDAVNDYIALPNQTISAASLNSFAWSVFENCDDPACLQAALVWSKKSLAENEDPMMLDTYANLLYKSGDKENAIKWQEKAVAKVSEAGKEELVANLEKMKKGLPTWE